jgi:hypothetical protein
VDNKDCEGPDGCHEAWVENGMRHAPGLPVCPGGRDRSAG